jgi:hypothetical protein
VIGSVGLARMGMSKGRPHARTLRICALSLGCAETLPTDGVQGEPIIDVGSPACG